MRRIDEGYGCVVKASMILIAAGETIDRGEVTHVALRVCHAGFAWLLIHKLQHQRRHSLLTFGLMDDSVDVKPK